MWMPLVPVASSSPVLESWKVTLPESPGTETAGRVLTTFWRMRFAGGSDARLERFDETATGERQCFHKGSFGNRDFSAVSDDACGDDVVNGI